jgi:hypothetical protein
MNELLYKIDQLQAELDQCLMAGMTPAPGVGEYVFEFDHPNGDTLICYLEIDWGEETEPARATLVNAYLGAVDVQGLLPLPIIDQIEAEALGHSWR